MPFFPASGGSSSPAGLPDYSVFVAPGGSDSASGTQGAPLKTLYAATANVIAAGGGTINFNNQTEIGGPVADQGLWLRNDDIAVPGFLNIDNVRLRFIGNGSQSGQFAFERPGAARMIGGSSIDCTKPGFWVVGSEVPMDVWYAKNFVPDFNGLAAPVRLGWDYARKPDYSLESLTLTGGNRASQATVMTVDLTTATSWVIQSGARTANVTTLVLTRPTTVALSPWVPGSVLRVNTSGDTDFVSGDYIVTDQNDGQTIPVTDTTIHVSYAEVRANHASKALVGTVKSHGCSVGDRVMIDSTNSEFSSICQQLVMAVSVDTVTLYDPYGYAPRSATTGAVSFAGTPVTMTKQVRGRSVSSSINFNYCSFYGQSETLDNGVGGPVIDIGGTSVAPITINNCYVAGGLNFNWQFNPNNYDIDRTMVSVLADPGGNTVSAASFVATNCQSQGGGIRFLPHQLEASMWVNGWLQDSAGNALPTVVCHNGTDLASVYLDQIQNADAQVAAVQIGTGYDVLKCQVRTVYSSNPTPVDTLSPIQGPYNLRSAYWNGSSSPTRSPWELGWNTIWPGGLTTPHVNHNRDLGPVQTRFQNIFPTLPFAVALPAHITITQDGDAPDGSATALKVVADSSYDSANTIILSAYPATWAGAENDYFAFGAWIKSADTTTRTSLQLVGFAGGAISWNDFEVAPLNRHIISDGWQWVSIYGKITHKGSGSYFIAFNIPGGAGTYYIYAPTIIQMPASTTSAQDAYELGANLKHQPIYLAPGMSGTLESTKFIAHGGLGVSATLAKTAGVGSGQLTLTGTGTTYVPIYAADGTTIQGWVAQLQATVNP